MHGILIKGDIQLHAVQGLTYGVLFIVPTCKSRSSERKLIRSITQPAAFMHALSLRHFSRRRPATTLNSLPRRLPANTYKIGKSSLTNSQSARVTSAVSISWMQFVNTALLRTSHGTLRGADKPTRVRRYISHRKP
jgi:hypothetical protein